MMDIFAVVKRWTADRHDLLRKLDKLSSEVARLRARNSQLQKSKALAEAQAESLRREKETLRAKAAAHRKAAEAAQPTIDRLSEKIGELRDELERLKEANN